MKEFSTKSLHLDFYDVRDAVIAWARSRGIELPDDAMVSMQMDTIVIKWEKSN